MPVVKRHLPDLCAVYQSLLCRAFLNKRLVSRNIYDLRYAASFQHNVNRLPIVKGDLNVFLDLFLKARCLDGKDVYTWGQQRRRKSSLFVRLICTSKPGRRVANRYFRV